MCFAANFLRARTQEASSPSVLPWVPAYLRWEQLACSGAGSADPHSALFWWGFHSVHFLEWWPAAGKGPQDLQACRNSALCSCNKRETERSVTTSGSHAPGLLEMFSPSENWRQMGTCCFVHVHHLLSSSFQIQWTRKELERETAKNKWTLSQVSHKGLSDRSSLIRRLPPHWLSCSISRLINKHPYHLLRDCGWLWMGGIEQNAQQRLHSWGAHSRLEQTFTTADKMRDGSLLIRTKLSALRA